jgi:biopolymer transport protein ExbD
MAFKPSNRRNRKEFIHENVFLPFLCLMWILVPILLSSIQFLKVGMINLNLPKAAGSGAGAPAMADENKDKNSKLNLSITITKKGFYVGSALSIATAEGEPTIPLKDGEYDCLRLSKYLFDLKEKAQGKYTDLESIALLAENSVLYKHIISVMDAVRTYADENGSLHILFPNVSIAAGII